MNRSDFQANIEILIERDPDNKMIPVISRGYRPINCFYLKNEIDKLPPIINLVDEEKPDKIPENLRDLFKKKMHIVNSIRKLSNDFHTAHHDGMRADISRSIKDLIQKKAELQASIEYIKDNPHIPEKSEDVELPDDDVELYKRQKQLADNIRYHKYKIQDAIERGDQDQISKREKLLAKKKIELAHVKRKLANKGYASR